MIPVLPGSILIGLAGLAWALLNQTPAAWIVFAGMVVLLAIGATSTYVLTTRRTQGAGIPVSSQVGGAVAGIVGFFVIPLVGVLVFFPLGLFLMEWRRLRDPQLAARSAWVALKAMLLGIGVEFAAALLAAGLWLVANVLWV